MAFKHTKADKMKDLNEKKDKKETKELKEEVTKKPSKKRVIKGKPTRSMK